MCEEVKGFEFDSEPEVVYLYFETDDVNKSISLNVAKKIPLIEAAIDLDDTIVNNENNPIVIKKGFHSSYGINTIVDYINLYLDKEEPKIVREPIDEPQYLEEIVTCEEAELFEKYREKDDEFGEKFLDNIVKAMALAYYLQCDELSHKFSKCCAFIIKQHPEHYKLDELNERLERECPSSDDDEEIGCGTNDTDTDENSD
jgi:hypothetical protein